MTRQSLKHVINEREREMILPSGGIQLPIINANTPTILNPLWNLLPFIIGNHGHPSFLWDDLNGRNPLGVRNRKDDPMIKQLGDFFLDYFHHGGIKSSLCISHGFAIILQIDVMHANTSVYPFDVGYSTLRHPCALSMSSIASPLHLW